eukprot:TRINITY_DN4551_c0_g1_i1.p1 TRINITY_DN4551_c0_g1~~TRINITY_DN4551_c0_g1_i1.p1  ORF type:complete len:180 (+),score=28.02 TRINITY_DN4551_c0_g1_i1:1-540(+)
MLRVVTPPRTSNLLGCAFRLFFLKMRAAVLVIFVAMLAGTFAHMCLLSPLQRVPIPEDGINQVANNACAQVNAPCGNAPTGTIRGTFKRSQNITVVFQKNLNHWSPTTQGSFIISFRTAIHSNFHILKSIPDTNTPSLTLFLEDITLPSQSAVDGLLQVEYNTAGSDGPFYQCADIQVV